MKALVQDMYGTSEVLRLDDVEQPEPAAGEVLVRIAAASVNAADWHVMRGEPKIARLMDRRIFGRTGPRERIRGRDFAGTIDAVGPDVTGWRVGDTVLGEDEATLAEYAAVPQGCLARKPEALSFEEAAALPLAAVTADLCLTRGRAEAGDRVLIIGASGGVGTFAVQLAKHFDAHVTGVCSAAKMELVRALGADAVIDYTREDFTERPERYDLIVDTAGRRPLSRVRRALTTRGTLVIVGGEGGGRLTGGFERQLRAFALSRFVSQRLVPLTAVDRRADLLFLKDIIEDGKLTPVIDRTFALDDAAQALTDAEEGHGSGKKVIVMM